VENFAGAFDGIPESIWSFFVAEKTETGVDGRIVILDDLLDSANADDCEP